MSKNDELKEATSLFTWCNKKKSDFSYFTKMQ
jgi:hypothetical protein